MFLKRFADAAAYPVWRFRTKSGAEEAALPVVASTETKVCGGFTVTKTEYAVSGGRATRVLITDGQQIAVVVDRLSLTEPRSVYTTFSAPQEKDLTCNVANRSRLVLRSAERGAKLFRLWQTVDGADGMDSAGLLLPDGFSDGAIRLAFYSGLYSFGRDHLSVFGLAEEQSDKVKGWHMEQGEGIEITAPDKSCRLRLLVDGNTVTVIDPLANACIPLL